MAEKLLSRPEKQEVLPRSPERKSRPTAEQAEALRSGEEDPLKKLQKARNEVKRAGAEQTTAIEREHLNAAEKPSQPPINSYVDQELKAITLRRELNLIRRKLPAPQRALSKVIHQPAVRAVSEGAGRTVSRPSGLLGGGITALLGTSAYLYLANHIGFRYNYGVFLVLFAGGFLLGLIIELAVKLARGKHRNL